MADCLTCEEIELKMCEIMEEIAAGFCNGAVIKEGDTTISFAEAMEHKNRYLTVLKDLWELKCGGAGAGGLYEFIHVPCVRPHTCVGSSCTPYRRLNTGRRYR